MEQELWSPLIINKVNCLKKERENFTDKKFDKICLVIFFVKKIPLSRCVEYVMDEWMSQSVSQSVTQSVRDDVFHNNQIGSTVNSQSNFFLLSLMVCEKI